MKNKFLVLGLLLSYVLCPLSSVFAWTTGAEIDGPTTNGNLVVFSGKGKISDSGVAANKVGTAPIFVASNADKLSLTELTAGQHVIITNEANRVELYMDAVNLLDLVVSGGMYDEDAIPDQVVTPYTIFNGRPIYDISTVAGSQVIISWTGTQWKILGGGVDELFYSTNNVNFPWEVTSWLVGPDKTEFDALPTLTRADPASTEANWVVIKNLILDRQEPKWRFIGIGNGVALEVWSASQSNWVREAEWTEE